MKCTKWCNLTNGDWEDMASVSTELGVLSSKSSSDHKLLCDLSQVIAPRELSFLTGNEDSERDDVISLGFLIVCTMPVPSTAGNVNENVMLFFELEIKGKVSGRMASLFC